MNAEPEYADGGGDGAGGMRFFLCQLMVRVRARGEGHGAVLEQELYSMLAEVAEKHLSPAAAAEWRAMAAESGSPV